MTGPAYPITSDDGPACPITSDDGWMMCTLVVGHEGPHDMFSVAVGDLKPLRAITDASTPGPWRYDGVDIVQLTDSSKGYPLDYYSDSKDVAIGKCPTCGNTDVGIQRRDDAAFIAATRIVVPALIDEIELRREQVAPLPTLRAEITRLREALREALDIFDVTWCPEHGHAPRPDQFARVEALRKRVKL